MQRKLFDDDDTEEVALDYQPSGGDTYTGAGAGTDYSSYGQ